MKIFQSGAREHTFNRDAPKATLERHQCGNLGFALLKRGKHAEAEAACRRAIALQPDHAEAHRNLGLALLWQGKLEEAEAALRQALTLTRARKATAPRKITGKK